MPTTSALSSPEGPFGTSQPEDARAVSPEVRDYLSTISRSRPQVTRTCEHCGAAFEARDSRARYCPRPKSCRELAMRARKKAKDEG